VQREKTSVRYGKMNVTIRFFALFGELFGKQMTVNGEDGTSVYGLIHAVAKKNDEGYTAIFNESGMFREFVIVMRNGRRISHDDARAILLEEGDEIAVFPPVAGG
jgi:sulfur-carrier protein